MTPPLSGTDATFSGPGVTNTDNEVLRGILGAPVLGDLQGNGTLDVVTTAMDRHVYAWQPDGKAAPGWPIEVVDPKEVQSVNPSNGQVTFLSGAGGDTGTKLDDTPAIAKLVAGGPPEVVVTSNEQYTGAPDASLGTLGMLFSAFGRLSDAANTRVYAIWPDGSLHQATCRGAGSAGLSEPRQPFSRDGRSPSPISIRTCFPTSVTGRATDRRWPRFPAVRR